MKILLWLALALAACGCESGPQLFDDVAYDHGLEFVAYSGDHLWYLIDTLGAGVAAGDYDGDGDADLLLLTGSAILDAYREEASRYADALWRNDGDGRFTDVTQQAGIARPGWSDGAVFADYDADGDLDIFVTRHGPNLLWRNNGDGTFTEVAHEAGVDDSRWSAAATFADFDGDGYLDLYVSNYAEFDIDKQRGRVSGFSSGMEQFPQHFDATDNILYRNRGDGTFVDITAQAGVRGTGRSLGLLASDFDDDGDIDLFVANDIGFNDLFRNDGDMHFENIGLEAGVACDAEGRYQATMGVAGGDYDNDGKIDILVTNYGGEYHTLYHNEGDNIFTDVTRRAGLALQETLDTVGWGVGFHDFDLDGFADILSINGHVVGDFVIRSVRWWYAEESDIPQMRREAYNLGADQPKHLFLGRGDGTFENIGPRAGWTITWPRQGRGAAFADFDRDGRVDVAVSNKNEPAQVLLNRMERRGHWLALQLRGAAPNLFAVGARVRVEAGGRTWTREVRAGSSYCSADDLVIHVGLGAAVAAEHVTVHWPDQRVETFEDLAADRLHQLREGSAGNPPAPMASPVSSAEKGTPSP